MRLIDADHLLTSVALGQFSCPIPLEHKKRFKELINNEPTITDGQILKRMPYFEDAIDVIMGAKKAKWVKHSNVDEYGNVKVQCSRCGLYIGGILPEVLGMFYLFCPSCGAKVEGLEGFEEEDFVDGVKLKITFGADMRKENEE